MAGKPPISDAAQQLLNQLQRNRISLPERDDLAHYRRDTRARFLPWIERARKAFDGEIKDIEIAGVACRQLTPHDWQQQGGTCIQYAFGGGFFSGGVDEDLVIAAPLAQLSHCRLIMVDYRLSPEHPYPQPQEDMRQVYPVLLDVFGAEHLAVCGESAGGNQVLSLLQHARNNGQLMPACAALLSPWCDLADPLADDEGQDPTLDRSWARTAADWHADGQALTDPGISPLYGDMTGLPPTLITSGSRDLLLAMSRRLADKMQSAGVDCELREHEGMWHVFEYYPIPEAEQSLRDIAAYLEART
ncbi:MAG TPA: alpha/beta hydrolase [Gammaproteobacteria bacterium]|jgi:acetyl esterase/lipase